MEQDRIERGKRIFDFKQNDNPFNPNVKVAKILFNEWFTSGHDDTGMSVSLCDEYDDVIWKASFTDESENDARALQAYFESKFKCPVEEKWLG